MEVNCVALDVKFDDYEMKYIKYAFDALFVKFDKDPNFTLKHIGNYAPLEKANIEVLYNYLDKCHKEDVYAVISSADAHIILEGCHEWNHNNLFSEDFNSFTFFTNQIFDSLIVGWHLLRDSEGELN